MAIPAPDVMEAAQDAGLRYTTDERPGIRRRRAGRGFRYAAPGGERVADAAELRRIRRLAIPPAWGDVWICPDPRGHLQATGRDAKGRKQYRYHARFREVRDGSKYERMASFARALPRIRARVDADLARPGLSREKVLASIVRLLETTLIRVGNEAYAKVNSSYGLTTLRARHVDIDGTRVRFRFRGKSGRDHDVDVRDRRVARVLTALQELPGQELFRYVDDEDVVRTVDSGDVNAYLREASGADYTAKDFRTWAGTVLAARALAAFAHVPNERIAMRNVAAAVEQVASRLGNTRAVCRRCYVHPAVLDAYLDGGLARVMAAPRPRGSSRSPIPALSADEARVLRLLERRTGREAQAA